jgi:hypothetical protein
MKRKAASETQSFLRGEFYSSYGPVRRGSQPSERAAGTASASLPCPTIRVSKFGAHQTGLPAQFIDLWSRASVEWTALSTETPSIAVPGLRVSAEQAEAVARVARFIVRFGMTVPAVLALETVRPLSYVGSQFMHLLSPSIGAFLSATEWNAMAALLEDRKGLDYVLLVIEQQDGVRA